MTQVAEVDGWVFRPLAANPIAEDPIWEELNHRAHAARRMHGKHAEIAGVFYQCKRWGLHEEQTFDLHTRVLYTGSGRSGRFHFSDVEVQWIYELLDAGLLLGIWHSHPAGHREPSEADWSGHPRGVPMYIICLEGNKTTIHCYTDEDRPQGWMPPDE